MKHVRNVGPALVAGPLPIQWPAGERQPYKA